MIVKFTITYQPISWDTGEVIVEAIDRTNFIIDTEKVQKYLDLMDEDPERLDHDELRYSETELRDLLEVVSRDDGRNYISPGGKKYSLYDTDWEYALVKADEGAVPEITVTRVVS